MERFAIFMEVRGQSFIMGKPLKELPRITKNILVPSLKKHFSLFWVFICLVPLCVTIFIGTKVIIIIHGKITIGSIVELFLCVVYLFYFL